MENKECGGRDGVLLKILRSAGPLSGSSTMVAGTTRAHRVTVESRDTVKLVNPFEDAYNNSVRLKTARMRQLLQGIWLTQIVLLYNQQG